MDMHYLGAVKKLFSDPLLYFINALLLFVPGPNIAIMGYLVSLTGRTGPDTSFGRFKNRFSEGFQLIAILLMYAVIPLILINFYSILPAIITLILLIPFLVFSMAMLGNGLKLGEILELRNLLHAYSWTFVVGMLKAGIFSLVVLIVHILIPIAGWVGVLYGPMAVFLTLVGEVYQDHFA